MIYADMVMHNFCTLLCLPGAQHVLALLFHYYGIIRFWHGVMKTYIPCIKVRDEHWLMLASICSYIQITLELYDPLPIFNTDGITRYDYLTTFESNVSSSPNSVGVPGNVNLFWRSQYRFRTWNLTGNFQVGFCERKSGLVVALSSRAQKLLAVKFEAWKKSFLSHLLIIYETIHGFDLKQWIALNFACLMHVAHFRASLWSKFVWYSQHKWKIIFNYRTALPRCFIMENGSKSG